MISSEGKQSITQRTIELRSKKTTWREIAADASIPLRTLQRYTETDMSPSAQEQRKLRSGESARPSAEQEETIIGLARLRRAHFLAVDIRWTQQCVFDLTKNWRPSESWVSKFWSQNHWKNLSTHSRNAKELRKTLPTEAATFRKEVEDFVMARHISRPSIWVMDEIGVWTGGCPSHTFVDPETGSTDVIAEGNHDRDTFIVAASADGKVEPAFIPHMSQRTKEVDGHSVVIQKGVSGVGTQKMVEWASSFVGAHEGPGVLLMDRLAAHRNVNVQSVLAKKFVPLLLPPQSSKLVSPLDNPLFANLKARLKREDISTREKKEKVFKRLCGEFPPEEVKKYWAHCGWMFPQMPPSDYPIPPTQLPQMLPPQWPPMLPSVPSPLPQPALLSPNHLMPFPNTPANRFFPIKIKPLKHFLGENRRPKNSGDGVPDSTAQTVSSSAREMQKLQK